MSASGASLGVGIVQMAMSESVAANDAAAEAGIREAAGRGARLVCLPELYRSRYFCQTETETETAFELAEAVPGETTAQHWSDGSGR